MIDMLINKTKTNFQITMDESEFIILFETQYRMKQCSSNKKFSLFIEMKVIGIKDKKSVYKKELLSRIFQLEKTLSSC